MSEPAIEMMAAMYLGRLDAEGWAPFEYVEADGSRHSFGECIVFRSEGSTGRGLAVGLWRVPDGGDSPVYSSQLGDETFLVLDGEATITNLDTHEERHLGVGDVCSWSKGTPTRWAVSPGFRKFFVVAEA